jgi:hypothetical protein
VGLGTSMISSFAIMHFYSSEVSIFLNLIYQHF